MAGNIARSAAGEFAPRPWPAAIVLLACLCMAGLLRADDLPAPASAPSDAEAARRLIQQALDKSQTVPAAAPAAEAAADPASEALVLAKLSAEVAA